ncbi:MAG: YkgJ family cysteine cluster protein [Armatimonadetes bacterium]|nr:YkgJ family cysteine cluster protein [Armatimonadota bacterium]
MNPDNRRAVITDLAVIARRARDLTDQNLRFRSWVKHECELSNEEFDALVAATADEVWREIDCTRCAMCCTMPSIAVNREDTALLAKRLGLRRADFERKYISIYEGEAGITGPCPFLESNRCTVYADRPKTCRSFPYLHTPGFRSRMLSLVGDSYFCPVVFNTLEALKRRLPWGKKRSRGSAERS